jgi:hypothetical protein
MSFVFDSGAMMSTLYVPFLNKHRKEIEEKYTLTSIKLGGAGGMHTYKGYILNNIELKSGNSSVILDKINLLSERPNFESKDYYGSIGQDFLKQFKTVVYNYSNMYIEFDK